MSGTIHIREDAGSGFVAFVEDWDTDTGTTVHGDSRESVLEYVLDWLWFNIYDGDGEEKN